MTNFSPVSEIRNGQRSWERVLAPNSRNKANMTRDESYNIRTYQSFGNSWSYITAVTVSIRLNDALYQTRQMEAKLPINASLELTPHLIRRMRRLFEDDKKKKSHHNLVIYNIQTFTTLSQQNNIGTFKLHNIYKRLLLSAILKR